MAALPIKHLIVLKENQPLYFLRAAEALILGFQHYLLTLGMTVMIPSIIVPRMGGGDVSNTYIKMYILYFSIHFLVFFSVMDLV